MSLQDDIARYEADYHSRMPARAAVGDVAKAIAAGLEREKIIIDRADLPMVVVSASGVLHVAGSAYPSDLTAEDASEIMRRGAALALHLQSRESEAAVLARRRDELIAEVGTASPKAIDRIIAAEAEVARLRASEPTCEGGC